LRRCTFSQKSALLPNTRAGIDAVSAVIPRRSLHSPLTCLRGTSHHFRNFALRQFERLHESWIRISPMLAGLRLVMLDSMKKP
jgi:hypothetical protein